MEEIIFIVDESVKGNYKATAIGASITAEADSYANLKIGVVDAVRHHFDDNKKRTIRLQTIREEILTA